jgi:hypothetical protein
MNTRTQLTFTSLLEDLRWSHRGLDMPLNTSIKQLKKSVSSEKNYDELLNIANEIAEKMTDKTKANAFIKNVEYLISIYNPEIEQFIQSNQNELNKTEIDIPLLDDDHYSF